MRYLRDYIAYSLGAQKYFFTSQEVMQLLGITPVQFRNQLYRLNVTEEVKKVTDDSFIIVPAEYSKQRKIPIFEIVDPLMKHLKREGYYIGLLSAAFLHNAIDHQPLAIQIIVGKLTRDIDLGEFKIEFHLFKEAVKSKSELMALPLSQVQVSSKEQTTLDLIRFHQDCGYLSNIAVIIRKLLTSESAKQPSSEKIFSAAINNEKNTALLQRLGHILEFIQLEKLASVVEKELAGRKMQPILLRPDLAHTKSEKRNERFKIVINDLLGTRGAKETS